MRADSKSLIPVFRPGLNSRYSQQAAGPATLAPQVEMMSVDHFKIFLMTQESASNRVA